MGKFTQEPKNYGKKKNLDPTLFSFENYFLDPSDVSGGSQVNQWAGKNRKRHPGPGEVNVKEGRVWANDPDQSLKKGETSSEIPNV